MEGQVDAKVEKAGNASEQEEPKAVRLEPVRQGQDGGLGAGGGEAEMSD